MVDACEACGSAQLEWERLSGAGTIAGWTTFERDYYGGILPIPWDTILVELAGGALMISNPNGFGWRDISVGMAVELAFVQCEDSSGAFNLPVFKRPTPK